MNLTPRDKARLWAKVAFTEGCWPWMGSTNGGGYGQMFADGSNHTVCRIAYVLAGGRLIPGMHIDHLCRNRRCVRFDHLEQVTPQENVLRGKVKGNTWNLGHTWNVGSKHGRTHLTEAMVRAIRDMYERGAARRYELAAMFGVSDVTMGCLLNRVTWKHVA